MVYTYIYIHQTVRLHSPEEHDLDIHCSKKLKIISIRLMNWCNDRVVLSLFGTAQILSDRFVIVYFVL